MAKWMRVSIFGGLLVLLPRLAAAGLFPEGAAFTVELTSGGSQQQPRQASRLEGNPSHLVVVWQGPGSGGDADIFARVYDPAAVAQTGEIPVNTYTAGEQSHPVAAQITANTFLVVWQGPSDGVDSGSDIHGRYFRRDGTALSQEFLFNSTLVGNQDSPAVVGNRDGDYVVVWRSDAQDGSGGGIYGRYLGYQGPVTAEIRINTTVAGEQSHPAVAVAEYPEPTYFVAWQGPDGSGNGIFLQRVGRDGVLLGSEIPVSAELPLTQEKPALVASSVFDTGPGASLNRLVLAWEGPDPSTVPPNRKRIFFRTADLDGLLLTPAAVIDTDPGHPDQSEVQLAIANLLVDGTIPFLAAFTESDPAQPGGSVARWAERPSSGPQPAGNHLAWLSPPGTAGLAGSLGYDNSGDMVGIWQEDRNPPGLDWGIRGQRFRRSLFADDFESGDTGAWSLTVP